MRGCQAPLSWVSDSHHDLLLACEGPFKTKCHLQITNLLIHRRSNRLEFNVLSKRERKVKVGGMSSNILNKWIFNVSEECLDFTLKYLVA